MAQLGRMTQALQCFDQALAIDPRDAEVWSRKGCALCVLGQFLEALECYERALAIDPRDTTLQHNKQALLAKLGRGQ